MIDLRYTNAPAFNEEQLEPSRSIGGWISRTPVPNGGANSIFQTVGLNSLCIKQKTTIALALFDETLTTAYLNITETDIFSYRFAIGEIVKMESNSINKLDRFQTRQIISNNTYLPQLNFEAVKVNQALNLTPVDGYSIIWLVRDFKEELPLIDEIEPSGTLIEFSREERVINTE